MKRFFIISIIILPFFILPITAQSAEDPVETILKGMNPYQAIAMANTWKWSRNDIKSYVDSRYVVFKLKNGKQIKIPLPKDKMLLAIAPYINQTHK